MQRLPLNIKYAPTGSAANVMICPGIVVVLLSLLAWLFRAGPKWLLVVFLVVFFIFAPDVDLDVSVGEVYGLEHCHGA